MARLDPTTRQRMVAGAAEMIRRRGLAATSVRDLARHAGVPLGSTYHYFPGGKGQLAAEAVRFAGGVVTRNLGREFDAGPVPGLRLFLAHWKQVLEASGYLAGCPVLAVAVEAAPEGTFGTALDAAAEVFAEWQAMLTRSLRRQGVASRDARRLATLVIAAVEGAVAMCRAQRSVRPLDDVAAHLEALLEAAVGA
jgi:AcrR family transcriptional regulator